MVAGEAARQTGSRFGSVLSQEEGPMRTGRPASSGRMIGALTPLGTSTGMAQRSPVTRPTGTRGGPALPAGLGNCRTPACRCGILTVDRSRVLRFPLPRHSGLYLQGLPPMFAALRDTRIYFDVEGAGLVPDGPRMRERPVAFIIHGGPGGDHSGFKPVDVAARRRACSSSISTIAARAGPASRPAAIRALHAGRKRRGHGGAAPAISAWARSCQHRHVLWRHGRDGARRALSGRGLPPDPDRHRGAWRLHPRAPGRSCASEAPPEQQASARRCGPAGSAPPRSCGIITLSWARSIRCGYDPAGAAATRGRGDPLAGAAEPRLRARRLPARFRPAPGAGRITAPTLILAGRHDWICPPEFSEEIQR